MSDSTAAAAAEQASHSAPKKGSKLPLIIGLVAVLLIAGGGSYWFFIMRPAAVAAKTKGEKGKAGASKEEGSAKEEGASKEKAEPAADEEESDEEPAEEKPKASKSSIKSFKLPDDQEVKKVVELQPFIVNLADKGESYYLRCTVSIGLGGEGKDEKPDPLFITRVRNAMLAVLTTKTSEEVLTPEGKALLRKELLRAGKAAAKEPKVLAIYITDLIVQL